MPEAKATESTEREQRYLVAFLVFGVSVLVLTTGISALLFLLDAPWWAVSAPLIIMGVLMGVATFLFLRRTGVSRGEAGLWGVIVASPLGDLIWFMKDPVRKEARDSNRQEDDGAK